ncbi:hypothetical protein OEZ85_004064 [Tetradesmus obliquus]|uniref:J domain-containing protein n=1 Tax=Tetradesmus obliquus TaxID=3088 RepID=A0ABY8UDA9_TETOB|nr:hypothetical protein OEZ85_004064 [Tetradesmus obliquus]
MTRFQVQDDADGLLHYRVLGLPRSASAEQIKQAYRALARRLHPDKGGSSQAFAALQAAFDVLSDPKARQVYDALASDVRFRPGAAAPYSQVKQPDAEPSPAPGVTEALLLQQLLRAAAGAGGAVVDPAVQLCITCEVCRRPATKECWTCRMAICDFCTRRQHWKGDVPLHWPLVDSPGRLLQQLGQQELEAKRKQDGAAYLASLPGYRPQQDVMLLRHQTDDAVLLAVHMPTGGTSCPPKLHVEATPSGLTLQHQGFAPVLQRAWAGAIQPGSGIASWASADGCTIALVVRKAQPGQSWPCCFKGDSYGVRCLVPPYRLLQLGGEVVLELPLPFWVLPEEDLQVHIGESSIGIAVDGLLKLQRTYWGAADAKAGSRKVVDVPASSWCVLEERQPPTGSTAAAAAAAAGGGQARRRPGKLLSISLALPPPTEEERQYKKGLRQNNAAATRACRHGHGQKGRAFFADDEDEFGLASLLQALLFHETGRTTLTPKPWESAGGDAGSSRWIEREQELPDDVQQQLRFLRGAGAGGLEAESSNGAL